MGCGRLTGSSAGERACFAATLVSELLDLSLAAGPQRDFLLGFLCGHLGFADIKSSAKRTWVLAALKRLLAAALAVENDKTEAWLRDIAAVAVGFCAQLQRDCRLVCDQGLQVLRCIARSRSHIVRPHLLTLAGLALGTKPPPSAQFGSEKPRNVSDFHAFLQIPMTASCILKSRRQRWHEILTRPHSCRMAMPPRKVRSRERTN